MAPTKMTELDPLDGYLAAINTKLANGSKQPSLTISITRYIVLVSVERDLFECVYVCGWSSCKTTADEFSVSLRSN
jgi:hypothetical protein